MKIVFIGASKFGLKVLQKIKTLNFIDVTGVVTMSRFFDISYSGKKVENVLHTDFSSFCDEENIPIFNFCENMKDPALVKQIELWNPDLVIVVGWYHMVPKTIRKIPEKGVIGMHASLLPKYRGGAPLVWAMINGEKEAGISLFYLEKGVDTGDLLGQRMVSINFNDNIRTLYSKIENEGIDLLGENLLKLSKNEEKRIPQVILDDQVWPQRSPEDGLIDWNMHSLDLYNFIRAQTRPYPGAFTYYKGNEIIIWEAKIYPYKDSKTYTVDEPGTLKKVVSLNDEEGVLVSTHNDDYPLLITKINYNGKDYNGREIVASNVIQIEEKFSNQR